MSTSETTKVIIKGVELNYVHLLKAEAGPNGGDPKFSVQIRVKKDATNAKEIIRSLQVGFKAAYDNAIKNGKWGKKSIELKKAFIEFVHDGDAKFKTTDDESYKGCWFFNANSKTAPQVIDDTGVDLTVQGHEKDVYSGMIGAVSVNFYAYGNGQSPKIGIACGLNNVCKTGEGSYAGGRTNAKSDFADMIHEPAPASEEAGKAEMTTVTAGDDPFPDNPF